jgi:hypothetical protein
VSEGSPRNAAPVDQPQRQPVRDIMKRCCLLLCSVATLVLAVRDVGAAPLDAETCGKLNGERLQLEFAGARANMAKGPEWAKGNLSPDAMKQVRRLIDIDAQMLFRCTGFNLVNLSPDVDTDADPPATGLKLENDGPAKAEPKSKAKQKSDGKVQSPDKKAPAKKPTGAEKKKAAAKPGPKAKLDDAYRPQKGDPTADPFAGKTKPASK